ncbi:hypothetical protein PV327_002731 [Microctonus hyperodae]|uniref:Uncharacterized protein n=1 Tax=Microctonus hyperodae TaxID=165561 RepID=A0AA39FG58_MICHY|nr:hypothetical protein PV327_002731 [Microctonus hyperodae]
MALVEIEQRKREEYEMQLFGFHSRAVNATLKSLVQEKIQSKCEKLFISLEKKYKPEGENIQKLKRNKKKLLLAYYHGYKSHLPAIETSVNKLITIPENVLLNEDKIQRDQYTIEDFDQMKKKVEVLQQRLKKAMIFNAILNAEIEIAEQFEVNINIANSASEVIEDGTKYPEVSSAMMNSIEKYKELQRNVDANDLNTVPNKRICLQCPTKSYDTNDL